MTPLAPVVDPAAWYADDLRRRDYGRLRLVAADLAELEVALAQVRASDVPFARLRLTDFVLPTLTPKLRALSREVLDGTGVAHVHGLPVERYDAWENIAALWIIGLHFGDAVSQNHKGHLLGHVTSLEETGLEVPTNRAYRITGDALPFHCDSCDVVGLLCLRKAAAGGETRFASSITVYNELLKRRPDLVRELMQPFYRDRRGEVPEDKLPYYPMPVFMFHEGRLIANYQPTYIRSAQRFAEVPRLTPLQDEALRAVGDIAEELCVTLPFEPGELQLLHNHVALHSRTAYTDSEEHKRHLLRLWLTTPQGRSLPSAFIDRAYLPTKPGERPLCGVWLRDVQPNVPLSPE